MKYYTHAGFFHADEVTGFAICRLSGICNEVVRLADLSGIPTDGLVADIGREWDPSENRFDHHQGFFRRNDETGVPLASAGMLWGVFGMETVFRFFTGNISRGQAYDVMMRVDETLIHGIDAHDADSEYRIGATCIAGKVRALTVSNIIAGMNTDDPGDHAAQMTAFLHAANLMESILASHIRSAWKFIQAKDRFSEVAEIRERVVILSEGLPWKEIVHELYPDALFVISPSNHPGNPWSMIAVPVEPESREVKQRIERPDWFDGFIHQGKWIAGGNSPEELEKLALWNTAK